MCLGDNLLQMYQWILQLQSSSPLLILELMNSKFRVLLKTFSKEVSHHKHHPTPPVSCLRKCNNLRTVQPSPKGSYHSISRCLYSRHLITKIKVITIKEITNQGINQQINMEASISTNSNKTPMYLHQQLTPSGHNKLLHLIHSKQHRLLRAWTRMWRNLSLYPL